MTFEQAEEIATRKAEQHGATIDKVYKLGDAYVFDTKEECMGIFPLVIDKEGVRHGLWIYLQEHDLTMDDMVEVE